MELQQLFFKIVRCLCKTPTEKRQKLKNRGDIEGEVKKNCESHSIARAGKWVTTLTHFFHPPAASCVVLPHPGAALKVFCAVCFIEQ